MTKTEKFLGSYVISFPVQWTNKAMNASGTLGCSLLFVFLMSFDTFNSQQNRIGLKDAFHIFSSLTGAGCITSYISVCI